MTNLYCERRRVLLIDENSRRLNLRAAILRNHEVDVHLANGVEEARPLWKNIPYDLVLLAAPENSDQAVLVPQQIRKNKPRQRIALLVGPPAYLCEIGWQMAKPRPVSPPPRDESPSRAQWPEIVQRVVSDWYVDQSARFALNKLAAPAAGEPPFLVD